MKPKKAAGKQIVAIILLAAGLIFSVFGVFGLAGRGGMDPYEARNSVVMVYSYLQLTDGQSAGAMGTGFAIGKPGEPVEYIVTNGHVVEYGYMGPKAYQEQVSSAGVEVYFSAAENDFVSAEVVYYSPFDEKDIAIIRLPSKTDKREAISIKDADKVTVGDTAYALGYPGVASNSQQFNTYDKNDVTLTKGIISKRTKPAWSNYDAFQMDVYINHGNSGGPLVDERGFLIGINSSGAVDEQGKSEGVNFAITSAELVKILDSENIHYTMAGGGISWAPTWFAYVFLPIGALMLVGGILLLVISNKHRQPSPAFAGSAAGTGAYHAPAGNRRNSAGKQAVLRGVTGKYAGQRFDLLQGKVVIGRDPAACNIVFDRNAPGISGRHCQVAYDQNEDCFLITDLGSSYGTFLGNGKKLTVNVTEKMATGDTFYLCDNANRFVVSKE